uniref:Serpin domain-containing protein n=1 Tax=Pelusios castaneus TaxID=367368 RepID=A0A8C8S682_9SAUR
MKSTPYLCLFLAGLLVVAHCHQVPDNHEDDHTDTKTQEHPPSVHENPKGKTQACPVACNIADFAFIFYKQVTRDAAEKNVFFSPLSISSALAMVALGAKSSTLTQILEGLTFNLTEIEENEIHEGFHDLLQFLNRPNSEIQLNLGNALFIDQKLKLLQKFSEDIENFYDAEAISSNFQNSAEAEKQINDYIEKKTHGKIANVVKDLDPFTLLALVNYIYFKGSSTCPFFANT